MEKFSIESIEYLKSSLHVVTLPIMANDIIKAFDELIEYKRLEKQGKLSKLSCAAGDTVYEVQKTRKRIQPYEIIAITIDRTGYRYYYWELKGGKGIYSNIKGFGDSRLGVDVFLTEEEAKDTLKSL